MFKITHILNRS